MRRILLVNVTSDMKLARPLYNSEGKILLNAGLELKDRNYERLCELGVTYVYIEDRFSSDIDIPDILSEKARIEAIIAIKSLMDDVHSVKKINAGKAAKIAGAIINELSLNKGVMVNYIDMHTRSDYLIHHSLNVCILAVLTGFSLGLEDDKIHELAIGGLLHDVGKAMLPPDILDKAERLSQGEQSSIRQHCLFGYDLLRKSPGFTSGVIDCALQHHERFDGLGYPHNLKGTEIADTAQIVSLADVYDALTSDASYRNALPIYEALAIIKIGSGSHFNPKIVNYFTSNIAAYPIGSLVRLNTGNLGVVVDISKESKNKPVVRILPKHGDVQTSRIEEIDLSKNPHIYIADVMER